MTPSSQWSGQDCRFCSCSFRKGVWLLGTVGVGHPVPSAQRDPQPNPIKVPKRKANPKQMDPMRLCPLGRMVLC